MRGHVPVARELIARARALAEELGLEATLAAGVLRDAAEIELLAGDAAAAERALREACDTLERRGDWGHYASVAPLLVDALHGLGRVDEATAALDLAAERTLADDLEARLRQHRARAILLAEGGARDLREAERHARAAVELAAQSDYLNDHAAALATLSGVLRLAGRPDEASAAAEEATELYERKGNVAWRRQRAVQAEPCDETPARPRGPRRRRRGLERGPDES
jgi:tetratricopeptide (TPR) repeat protein